MIEMKMLDYVVDVFMLVDRDAAMKVVFAILDACVIAVLYFLGRKLHYKKPDYHPDAVMRDKTPYIKAMSLKRQISRNGALFKAKKAIGSVEDRLRNESDFGYGSSAVTECENTIYRSLKAIEELLKAVEESQNESCDGKCMERTDDAIVTHCETILSDLRLRMELKKK